jgi:transcriptional regulator with XRE-family HTH domain
VDKKMTARLGSELRAMRSRQRITQVELAALAGVHPSTVHRLETGDREAKVGQLLALATALDISATDLLPELAGGSAV